MHSRNLLTKKGWLLDYDQQTLMIVITILLRAVIDTYYYNNYVGDAMSLGDNRQYAQ